MSLSFTSRLNKMTHSTYIALVFLGFSLILKVATKDIKSDDISNNVGTNIEEKVTSLERSLIDLTSRIQKAEMKNIILEEKMQKSEMKNIILKGRVQNVEKKNEVLEEKNQNLEKAKKDVNDELSYLKELSKLNVVQTCEEMADYGVNQSNYYLVDPDGPLMGNEPIRVYCEFSEGSVSTIISHDSEETIEVGHCTDPGCYSRQITYDAPIEQIQSLIELSNTCNQQIKYDCFLSPLQIEGIDFGFWRDKNGDDQIYWTDSHFGEHVCSCHYSEEGCFDQETLGNTCNCDSNKPSELSDVGIITNSSALPIMELRFGGLEFDAQSAFHTLGNLSCSGKKTNEPKPVSCSSLKRMGYFKSGFYNVKEDGQFSKLVYCDMTSLGYDDVHEDYIESSETHFDEIEQYLGDYVSKSDNHFSQLDKAISDIIITVEVCMYKYIMYKWYEDACC